LIPGSKLIFWQQDQELEAATREYEKDWGLICTKLNETFSTNLTNSQCQKRWAQYISPDLTERKMGPWSADEVCHHINPVGFDLFIGNPFLK